MNCFQSFNLFPQYTALQNVTLAVKAHAKSRPDFKENHKAIYKEIDELDKRLLKERTTLEQLNGQLQENKEKTDKATGANKSFGDEIRDVASSLGLNISPALEKLAKKFRLQ